MAFKVGDFIVVQETDSAPDFGVIIKITNRQSQFCDDSTHYDMFSVRYATGEFISFADECQHYEDWRIDNGI